MKCRAPPDLFSCSDYETVLKLSPGNMEALCEVKKIKEVKPEPYLAASLTSSFPEGFFLFPAGCRFLDVRVQPV